MNYLGYIEIKDNKVIFVYHELSKPDCGFNQITGVDLLHKRDILKWNKAMEEYKASKQEAEVGNIIHDKYEPLYEIEYFNSPYLFTKEDLHNQPCEAEITKNKAIITKIL